MFGPNAQSPPADDVPDDSGQRQPAQILGWRVECLIRAGADVYWAGRFAAYDNWRLALTLLEQKCPQAMIDKIL